MQPERLPERAQQAQPTPFTTEQVTRLITNTKAYYVYSEHITCATVVIVPYHQSKAVEKIPYILLICLPGGIPLVYILCPKKTVVASNSTISRCAWSP